MMNSAEFKRKINKLQNKLIKLNALKQEVRENLDIKAAKMERKKI